LMCGSDTGRVTIQPDDHARRRAGIEEGSCVAAPSQGAIHIDTRVVTYEQRQDFSSHYGVMLERRDNLSHDPP
jgi:hypothetical protein